MPVRIKKWLRYFSAGEWLLLGSSVVLIVTSFLLFDRGNYLTLTASLIGVLSLLFAAKGNPAAHVLVLVFSAIYGYISYSFHYYGEMLTYLGMTAPMAVVALISWLRNPYKGNHAEVKVNRLGKHDALLIPLLTAAVTAVFYFLLRACGTANLVPSTISVTTSFAAVYLSFRRSPFYALAYAANDIVLIVLWAMAAITDRSYVSVMVCFLMFLANDIYGFASWLQMQRRQSES